jgi:hypothetical protein
MKICNNCKSQNPDEATFCRNCGMKFTPQQPIKPSPTPWKIIIPIIAVIVVGLVAWAAWFFSQPSYINVANNSIEIGSEGGSDTIKVNTDATYSQWNATCSESWVKVEKNLNDELIVTCDANTTEQERRATIFLETTGRHFSQLINITQGADNSVSAEIISVTVDHNVTDENGSTGMRIHVNFTTHNMENTTGYCQAQFFQSDDQTALTDDSGNEIGVQKEFNPNYKDASFNDMTLFLPYSNLPSTEGSNDYCFDIVIVNSEGKVITRKENTTFNLTRPESADVDTTVEY